MKYCVENQLNLFEFHDSEFLLVSYDGNDLVVSAKHLNIHKDAKENPYDCDMEITSANITFQDVQIISLEPMRAYQIDDDGNWYTNEPQIIFRGIDAENRFIDELKKGTAVNCFEITDQNNKTHIDISTCRPNCFFAAFAFGGVTVEWDEYWQKAWYELHKQYRYETTLATPNRDVKTNIHIVCHEEDIYYKGKLEKAPNISVGIEYEDTEIWGHGKDYFWIDAFADMQKQLPEGVTLKCCLTCRHGNMCPYGNKPGELFCTKDLIINSKEEMCDLFYNAKAYEIEKRSKNHTDICCDYQCQSLDFYTYNDYLYELNK